MIQTTINKLPKSKIELKVEVPNEDFLKYTDQALTELAKEAEIEGFRKGMAPKELIKSKLGDQKILDYAARVAIEETYIQAMEEHKIEPLGYPQVEILKLASGNPFEYKIEVAVFPEVKLPDYKALAAEIDEKEPEVTEEDIKKLKMEKKRHAKEHLREEVVQKISQKTEMDTPEILILRETEKMLSELKEKVSETLKISFDDYLKKIKKTEAELKESLNKENEQKIKNWIILEEIAKMEKIEVSEEEIEDAVKKVAEDQGDDDRDKIRDYYKGALKNEKVFELLESFFQKKPLPNK